MRKFNIFRDCWRWQYVVQNDPFYVDYGGSEWCVRTPLFAIEIGRYSRYWVNTVVYKWSVRLAFLPNSINITEGGSIYRFSWGVRIPWLDLYTSYRGTA